jgi:hypothetical protein
MLYTIVDLTRFRGHLSVTQEGDQDGKVTATIYTRVSSPDGGSQSGGALRRADEFQDAATKANGCAQPRYAGHRHIAP